MSFTAECKRSDAEESDKQVSEEKLRFSAAEEESLLIESNTLKAAANELFAKTEYNDAIDAYTEALSTCPNYLDYEVAVLKSNIAACYLKLQKWKETTVSATTALEKLQNLMENLDKEQQKAVDAKAVIEEDELDETIISAGAAKAQDTSDTGKRRSDIERIKTKALIRRARANCEIGSWSALQSAQEDYNILSKMSNLSPVDRQFVQKQLILLPSQTKAAQDKEIGDLMGQLKNIGNGILRPFGLSTDNFQMQKDEKTGSYSMNFNQNPSGS
ncbi:Tetratricopeptide repeat protein 1 [Erysiphe neolycopersici]|uniref:Tetratricopeptide repeat protein 1 n=1 Tax=Erysiphe neolycopersici TaxID=212602 RepID=A0A420HAU2_9PEZI|nr:Tetratricopeptide repeat protein 1 [Erysiphe neolycopersici]